MASLDEVKNLKSGAKISFKPGGRGSNEPVSGSFVRMDEPFVVVKGGDDREKKVRPGQITILQ